MILELRHEKMIEITMDFIMDLILAINLQQDLPDPESIFIWD